MENDLQNRETRKKVVDFTLNAVFMGALKGALVAIPLRFLFRSPALGYFIIAYSIGNSLSRANNFLLDNVKEP